MRMRMPKGVMCLSDSTSDEAMPTIYLDAMTVILLCTYVPLIY